MTFTIPWVLFFVAGVLSALAVVRRRDRRFDQRARRFLAVQQGKLARLPAGSEEARKLARQVAAGTHLVTTGFVIPKWRRAARKRGILNALLWYLILVVSVMLPDRHVLQLPLGFAGGYLIVLTVRDLRTVRHRNTFPAQWPPASADSAAGDPDPLSLPLPLPSEPPAGPSTS